MAWLWPSRVPVRWISRPRTWRMARVRSHTVPLNRATTSSPSASLRNMCQVNEREGCHQLECLFFFSLLISNNLRCVCVCSSTGSPFTVRVTGEGRIRESISRRQRAASVASVGSACDFSLRLPGTQSHFYSGSNASWLENGTKTGEAEMKPSLRCLMVEITHDSFSKMPAII